MKQKPTLLFVITQGGPWGGAQKYVADLAEACAEEFLVVVAVGEPRGARDLQERLRQNPEIDVVQLRHLRREISPLHDLLAIAELRRLYKKIGADVIHLNSTKAGILGALAATRRSVVYTVHGWVFHEPMSAAKRLLYRFLEKTTARMKRRIIVLSQKEAASGKELGIPQHKLAVIPPGIDARPHLFSRHDARAKLREAAHADIPMDAPWIGAIANHYPTKGLDILLRALGEESDIRAHAVIVGHGPEYARLRSLAESLHVADRVHFTGFLPDAPQYLPAFDVFVLPSRKEGLPYTLLEAKFHGIPMVATDVGGVSELIQDKITGRIVPTEDVLALGTAIRETLADLPAARQMAETGMRDEAARRYSKTRMIEDTTALYRSVLEAK